MMSGVCWGGGLGEAGCMGLRKEEMRSCEAGLWEPKSSGALLSIFYK